jgi:hypothetical protein
VAKSKRVVFVDARQPGRILIEGSCAYEIAKRSGGTRARQAFSGRRWIIEGVGLPDVIAAIESLHLIAAVSRPIRRGQDAGEIRTVADKAARREVHRGSMNTAVIARAALPSAYDFASRGELHGNQAGIYRLTDDVSDADFDGAITTAKAEI